MLLEGISNYERPAICLHAESTAPKERLAEVGSGRNQLRFLDGIRGVAALYVVADHAAFYATDNFRRELLPGLSYYAVKWLAYGQFAVAVFIVLSGYCLMLPVAKSASGELRGGTKGYFLRRAKRILPPYYVALTLTLLLLWLRPGLPSGSQLNTATVISHFAMVHLVREEWNHAINSPMWSVATEWWIYFALPWILLPVWKRWGASAMIAAAAIVAAVPSFWGKYNFEWARPWYLVLFAMGAAAADFGHSRWDRRGASTLERISLPVALGAAVVLSLCFGLKRHLGAWYSPVIDSLQGTIAVGFIVWLASDKKPTFLGNAQRRVRAFFESRSIHFLGVISYSLYLIHYPLLELLNSLVVQAGITGMVRLLLVGGMGTAVAVLAAYLFYLPFERPFCGSRARSKQAVMTK
jgi:peptidoglycan/LPS O-acetylase OafA/YrhL